MLLQLDLGDVLGEPILTILGTVVRVANRGPDEWVAGCNFIRELSEEELRLLD